MNRGFVKLWRSLEDSGITGNADVCQMYVWLLLKAASKPYRQMAGNTLVSLEPGQAVVGRRRLAAALGSTEQRVRTALKFLEKTGFIALSPSNKCSIVTLLHWVVHQQQTRHGGEDPALHPPRAPEPAHGQPAQKAGPCWPGPQEPPRANRQATSAAPASPAQPTTRQEAKKGAKEEDHAGQPRNSPLPGPPGPAPSGGAPLPDPAPGRRADPDADFKAFRAFYSAHGRSEAPLTGLQEFRRLRATGQWPGMEPVSRAVLDHEEQDPGWRRFAPGLARFLRERWWEKPVRRAASRPAQGGAPGPSTYAQAQDMERRQRALRVLARQRETPALPPAGAQPGPEQKDRPLPEGLLPGPAGNTEAPLGEL